MLCVVAFVQRTLEDCRWALKVDENCVKAAVLEGRAYVGLKQYDTAIECYKNARQMDVRKESIINAYIDRARIRRDAERAEQTAGQTSEASHETGLVSILTKVKQPDQQVVYYIGGLEVIRRKLCDSVSRTLFRSSGGFELADCHCEISRCLSCRPADLNQSQVELTAVYLTVLLEACVDNDDNQCQVLDIKHLPHQLMTFIECLPQVPACHDIASAGVNLLLYLSQTARNRSQIVMKYDSVRLMSAAFVLAQRLPTSSVAVNIQRLICNLAITDRLRRELRDDFEQTVVSSFNSLLRSDSLADTVGPAVIVKTMVNLCGDEWLRRRLSNNHTTWSACINALTTLVDHQSTHLVSVLISLLANMAIDGTSSAAERDLTQLCGSCTDLVTQLPASDSPQLVDQCYLLLSRVLRVNSQCVEPAVCKQLINATSRDLNHLLCHQDRHVDDDGDSLLRHCLAAMTACTLHSDVSRQHLSDVTPSIIRHLVHIITCHQSYDDVIIGNAALCLSHCVYLPSAIGQLTAAAGDDTDIIMSLLVLARDQAKPTVQHNCAILIAKLVSQHERYLDRLRQLHGLEILHTVLTHVKQ